MANGSAESKVANRNSADVRLSKTLSYILRHGAARVGLTLQPGGFLFVSELLSLPQFRSCCSEDIERVVRENAKRRFHLEEDGSGRLRIRANQGHSVQVDNLALSPITNHLEFPVVLHGTYTRHWPAIRKEGLRRMKRTHIHFTCGEPGSENVVSGMRQDCEILVFIDLKKALTDNLLFFTSANNVILSPGNKDGRILPIYFSTVIQRRPHLGEIHSRLLDHRPVLNGEINFHLKEFEEKRNDRETVRLHKALHYAEDGSEKMIPATVQLLGHYLPDLTEKLIAARGKCCSIQEKEYDTDRDSEAWLKERRTGRVKCWSHFLDQMCERTAAVDRDHEAETSRIADYYTDLEHKLKITAK